MGIELINLTFCLLINEGTLLW